MTLVSQGLKARPIALRRTDGEADSFDTDPAQVSRGQPHVELERKDDQKESL